MDTAIIQLNEEQFAPERYKVSAYLRERDIAKQPLVTVVQYHPSVGDYPEPTATVEEIISSTFPKTVSDRIDRALQNMARMSSYLGESMQLDPDNNYPVLFAKNKQEYYFIRDQMIDAAYIDFTRTAIPSFVVTGHGWNRLAELEHQKGIIESKQVFVAMSFDPTLDKIYSDGIAKSVSVAGYDPMRVDLKEHNEKICDRIIAEIRRSRFMIADFTGHRSGVYYEAGFAQGLGMEVIWTCRKDEIDKAHFDTRQYNHIVWENEQDLYEKLVRRIEATFFR